MVTEYKDGIPANEDYDYQITVLRPPTVDDHFTFFKQVCDYVNDYRIVRAARDVYASTKTNWPLLDRTLTRVENGAANALDYTAPIYENYVYPTTNRLYGTYSRGAEKTKSLADRSKSLASTSATLSFGVMVVAAEMGLTAGASATRLLFDGLIGTKRTSETALATVVSVEKQMEQRIFAAINQTYLLIKNPSAKLNDHANAFLDAANAIFERLLSLPVSAENPESSLLERVKFLSTRIARGLTDTANQKVVEPCQAQLAAALEQLQKCLVVVDYLKDKKEWTFQHMEQLGMSANEIRVRAENEGRKLFTQPEEALISYIHEMSRVLVNSIKQMRDSGEQILNAKVQKHVNDAVEYVAQFSDNLQHADDLYTANGEVVDEARRKLVDLARWYKQKAEAQTQNN